MNERKIQQLWTNQPIEKITMTTEELQGHAKKFQRKINIRNNIEYFAGFVVIFAFGGYMVSFPNTLMRIGSMLAIAGTIFVLYQLHRRTSIGSLPEHHGDSYLSFVRTELERQRDALNSVWHWYVAPFIPGLLVFRWSVETNPAAGAHFATGTLANVLIAVVLAVVVILNRIGAKNLQKKIDDLDRVQLS